VIARITAFDPGTGELRYITQAGDHSTDPPSTFTDDPADPAVRTAILTPGASITFAGSSCSSPYGAPSDTGIACTPADLAAATGSGFLAGLELVDGDVAAVNQVLPS